MFIFKCSCPVGGGPGHAPPDSCQKGLAAQLQGVWPAGSPKGGVLRAASAAESPLRSCLGGDSQQQGAVLWMEVLPFCPRAPHCLAHPWMSLHYSQHSSLFNPAFTIKYEFLGDKFKNLKLVMSHECTTKKCCSDGPEEEEPSES